MGLRGDTLRLGLLPPLRGGRLAWPAPRAWDYPNPALPPYDVKTPHTWSPAYGGYIARRAYLQDGLCVYLRVTLREKSTHSFIPRLLNMDNPIKLYGITPQVAVRCRAEAYLKPAAPGHWRAHTKLRQFSPKSLGQQYTEICSKSEFWHTF